MTAGLEAGLTAWLEGGATLLGIVFFVAVVLAILDWLFALTGELMGWAPAPAGHLLDWTVGLGSLPTSPLGRGEPLLVSVGYAVVAASATLLAALAGQLVESTPLPGGLGLFAFAPLLFAFGYSLAAQGAATPEAARRRLLDAGRILFATPAWAVTLAAWAALAGALGPLDAAGEIRHPAARAAIAAAILWTGLFVLPGAAGEIGLASRPWGGDAHEASRAVRLFTALAHYASFAAVIGLAAAAVGGTTGRGPSYAAVAWTALAALAMRHFASWPPASSPVRVGARLLPAALLVIVLVLALFREAGA